MRILIIRFIVFSFILIEFAAPVLAINSHGQDQVNTYKIIPSKSELLIRVYKSGVASLFGHNHIIEAELFNGIINFDDSLLSRSSVDIEVKADSLKADLPGLRKKYNLNSALDKEDREQIAKDMMGKDQMDIKNYPLIKFHSDTFIKNNNNNYLVSGDLTIHGVTKKISANVHIKVKDNILIANSSFKIKQSDFNIKPFSAALGMIKNSDEVLIIFNFTSSKINIRH